MNQLIPLFEALNAGQTDHLATAPKSLRAADLPMLRPPVFNRRAAQAAGRTPTHRECRPYRPRHQPRWSPTRDRKRASSHSSSSRLWLVKLVAAPDLGPVRVNFRYNNIFSTSADFCEKSGRQQFCEEAHEIAWRRWAIVNPNCTDVQFQPVKAIFEDAAGNQSFAVWDIAIEFYDGSIVFAEIKADESFFFDHRTALIASASAAGLSPFNIPFARLHGTDFDDIAKENIKYVFDFRRTDFDAVRDVDPVVEAIVKAGSQIALGKAIEVIDGHASPAQAKLCAMMVKRHIAIDLSCSLSSDTAIGLAPKSTASGALRRFLASCTPDEESEE